MRASVLGVLALLVAGCTPPLPQKGAFVPFQQVMAETRDRPYECFGWDPVTQSCETLSINRLRGTRLSIERYGAFDADGKVVSLRSRIRGRVVDNRPCIGRDTAEAEVLTDIGPVLEPLLEELMEAISDAFAGFCGAYYRGADGSYVTELVRPDGVAVEDGLARSVFFAERPKLRAFPLVR